MASKFHDDEAEREDEEEKNFVDSSDEEDDEDLDAYEKDDFLVNDDEQDDDDFDDDLVGETTKKKPKKKRKKYRDDEELAEGDLQLLEDTGIRVRRKKLKKLRKGGSDDEDLDAEVRGLLDEDPYDREDRSRDRRRNDDVDFDYDDDMDDFIDDGGRGRRRRAAERKGLVSSEVVREARSIFGDAEDITQYVPTQSAEADPEWREDGDAEEDEDDDDEDDFFASGRKRPSRRPRTVDDVERTESAIRAIAATTLDEEAPVSETMIKRYVEPDVPERLIKHFGTKYVQPNMQAMKDEAQWIYNYAFFQDPNCGTHQFEGKEVKKKIGVFLRYLHGDKLDIPFIAMYRKDYILPELICDAGENLRGDGRSWDDPEATPSKVPGFNSIKCDGFDPAISIEHLHGVEPGYDDGFGDWTTLWKILDWDKKYMDMNRRKAKLLSASDKAIEQGVEQKAVEAIRRAAPVCNNDLQVGDVERYLNLHLELAEAERFLARGGVDQTEGGRKSRPSKRKMKYKDHIKRGFRVFVEYFGISTEDIAANVHVLQHNPGGLPPHNPNTHDDDPLQAARVFLQTTAADPQRIYTHSESDPTKVLTAARYVLMREICAELLVIQAARAILNKEGTVTIDTKPTAAGIAEVGESHPLRHITHLQGKKLNTFTNTTDFVLTRDAEKKGYLKLSLNFQDEQVHLLSEVLQKAMISTYVTASASALEKWNNERKIIANDVLEELKLTIKVEILNKLLEQGNETLRRQLTQAYSRKFLLGPTMPGIDGSPKVLAVLVTKEEDEEPDRLQAKKDAEDAAEKGGKKSLRRPAKDRLTMVVVDENGEFKSSEELFAGWLQRPYSASVPEQVVKELENYISLVKPRAIVIGVGSGGKSAIRVKDDIRYVLVQMLRAGKLEYMLTPEQLQKYQADAASNENAELIYRFIDPYVTCIDEGPAKIYARCKWASIGLPIDNTTLLEKRALALGRMAQEPLIVYSAICTDSDVNTNFAVHEYHFNARRTDRVIALERALIRAVCTTGVDINRLLGLPHMKTLLNFVGGLGEYKSAMMITKLEDSFNEEDKALHSRKFLWTKNIVGPVVFNACAAFLRVRDPELHPGGSTIQAVEHRRKVIARGSRNRSSDNSTFFDPMDDSRIHPEHYAVAIKIADEALRDDDGNLKVDVSESNDIPTAVRVISAVLDDPSGLRRLALDEYADHLYKLNRGKLYETVKLIAREFHVTFADYRRPLVSPHSQAIFYLVTKANPREFRLGSQVMATNCRISRNGDAVDCWCPHNVRGFLSIRDFSDSMISTEELREFVSDGCSIQCRIIHTEWDRFRVRLSAKPSVLNNPTEIFGYVELVNTSDPAYRPYPKKSKGGSRAGQDVRMLDARMTPRSTQEDRRMRRMTTASRRDKQVVNHRHYREISGPDAVEALRGAEPGDTIIRPSAYNKNAYMFSCRFHDKGETTETGIPRGLFHIEFLVERDPATKEFARLRIGTDAFDDIDEAIEQFVHPIVGNLKEGMDHRKYLPGGEDDLKKAVIQQKLTHPNAIPYHFGLSAKKDLTMALVYLPGRKTPRVEYISVVPHGFRYREVLHNNLDSLTRWFKKNMDKTDVPRAPSRPLSVVSRPGTVQTSYGVMASPFHAPNPANSARPTPAGIATPAMDAPPPSVAVAKSPFSNNPVAPSPFHAPAVPPPPADNGRNNWNGTAQATPPPPPPGQNGHTPGRAMPTQRFDAPPPMPPPMHDAPMRGLPRDNHMRPRPRPRDNSMQMRQHDMRGPPQSHRGPPHRDMRGPPTPMGGGHGRGMPPQRMGGRGMGPPPMGRGRGMGMAPPPHRGPSGGAGPGRGRGREMAIPAWKKKQMEQEQSGM